MIMKKQSNDKVFQLAISLFAQIPPDKKHLKELFEHYSFDPEQLAALAYEVAQNCFCEYHDAVDESVTEVSLGHMHSDHLLNNLQFLLDNGLDPNVYVGEFDDNAMWTLEYADAPNVGASAMRLLLEHGFDPNYILPSERESIFESAHFAVSYDSYTHEYFHRVQCWWVLMAYGGRCRDGTLPLTMLNGTSVEILRYFENYDYTIESLPQEPGYYGCWIMHIFNTTSNEEVARYG